MKLHSLLSEIRNLIPADLPQPDLAVREIFQKELGISSTELIALSKDTELPSSQEQKIRADIAELQTGKPLAYILGTTEFFGHHFKVTPDVLIPRPETEGLVEQVLQDLIQTKETPTVLEVGVGSGCIAASLLFGLRQAGKSCTYIGIDISKSALSVCAENISSLLGIKFTETQGIKTYQHPKLSIDLRNISIADLKLGQPVTHLVSNPPYITTNEYRQLDKSVRDFEPKVALEAGDDGMDVYTKIAKFVVKLSHKPRLWLEISPSVAAKTRKLFRELYSDVDIERDLFGRERFLRAK